MNNFNFFVPTQIRFGAGRINEVSDIVLEMGRRCLLVTSPDNGPQKNVFDKVKKLLSDKDIEVFHYDGVVPNPTTDCVEDGIKLAIANDVNCVLAVGGGSSMDTAKLIALLYNKKGEINWNDAIKNYSNPFKISDSPKEALPLVAIPTTAGTGSHVTQAAVVSITEDKEKITVFHSANFPKYAIVDPELTLSLPAGATAATGFDAFSHSFESFQGSLTSPLTETMALQAIKLVFDNLSIAVSDPSNIEARTQLALADTLAGMCLATGGADIPHPLGEIIGGICPRVAHGNTLAIVYPEYLNYKKEVSAEKFAKVAKALSKEAENMSTEEAAEYLCTRINKLLSETKLANSVKESNFSSEEISSITNHPLLDMLNPEKSKEIKNIMINSFKNIK